MRINAESLEELHCFQYMGSQVAADGGCENGLVQKMNEGYKAL